MELKNSLPEIVTGTLPGPKVAEMLELRKSEIPTAIGTMYPLSIARGEGAMIEDLDGNRLLDWIGGVGVLNLGYSNPEVIEAVKEQVDKYFHCHINIISHQGYLKLAQKLNEIMPVKGDKKRTMFVNSGAEADENAVKIARAYTGRPNIIVFSGAFHGRTSLTMQMTARKALAKGMGPFPDGVYRVAYPDMYHLPKGMSYEEGIDYYYGLLERALVDQTLPEMTAAILFEPVLGEGGFIPAPIEWVKKVRALCDKHGILLVADEVQSGWCRSGKLFVSSYWKEAGCAPDIIATAKSMGAGLPISAVTARTEIYDAVPKGTIGGTYCGNPVSCASALKTIEIFERDDYPAKANHIGEAMFKRLNEMKEKYEVVGDVRGIGAMVGIEFVTDKASKAPNAEIVTKIINYAIQKGLMLENAGVYDQCIRFLAPLVMTDEQMECGLAILEEAIQACM